MKCIQYDPLGDIFVVGGAQNNVGVFQVMSAAKPELPPFEIIDAHQALVTCIVFSKLGNYMATGGADSLILLWKLPELLSVASFMSVESEIRSMSFSFDEKWFSVVASEEMLHVFSVEKGLTGLTDSVDTVKCEGKSPQCVVYHPQKQTLAFVCQDSKDSVIHLYSS
jgi:WD40 repeat protein